MAVAMAMPQRYRPFGGGYGHPQSGFGQPGFQQFGQQPGYYQGGFGQPGFQQNGFLGPTALSK
jgi:hypothetical protein